MIASEYDWSFDNEYFVEKVKARLDELDLTLSFFCGYISVSENYFHALTASKFPSGMSRFIRVCNELDIDPRECFKIAPRSVSPDS